MAEDDKPPTYSADKARQGEIILRTRTRKFIFIGGLVALVVFAIAMRFLLLR